MESKARHLTKQPSVCTHLKGLAGGLVDPLYQFVGGVGAPLDMRGSPQDMLQHTEGQGVGRACRHRLTHHCTVDHAAPRLLPHFTCMPQEGDTNKLTQNQRNVRNISIYIVCVCVHLILLFIYLCVEGCGCLQVQDIKRSRVMKMSLYEV